MMKGQKGITLVALVITIIVMLILVGVTISIALNQGGVVDKAEDAGNQYKDAAAQESAGNILKVNNEYVDINSYIDQQANVVDAAE